MKKNDLNNLKNQSTKELRKKLGDLNKSLMETTFEMNLGKVKNVHTRLAIKKDIARVNTFLKIKGFIESQNTKEKGSESKKVEPVGKLKEALNAAK